MRHNKKFNHLGRKSAHRDAMLANMCVSLLMSPNKRIFTTVAKAKALKKVIEPIITKAKEDSTHARRLVYRDLKISSVDNYPNQKVANKPQDRKKLVIAELFQNISQKVGDRQGGYTRIIKTGNRLGDNASMCFIELVDYNENMLKEKKAAATKGRTRRSKKKDDTAAQPVAKETAKKAKAEKVEKEKEQEVEALEVAPESLPVVEAEAAAPEVEAETPAEEKPKTEE
ncbi:large subunit ribosomal protein L17 [Dysgonomonas sp. PFB1-18]|nr:MULTISPECIES: 50S ribosomal protein L17 [unclassified Dysgonomonas]MDH6307329.1 large subunit ribosomal protein L17 [Dysgonomonas sp. PF1-14]MDH6337247.1 large subunit ribosomal protein L17 [Dysgonomonas sp. PF1-16]MDH6379171.1 large subunit ribosomal protein L17 [Dysgonomonas sp. PFB1-18]MDH6396191.1 large subunit ribosomal protein L17 [Dysgonomonas sp. PF1-23]